MKEEISASGNTFELGFILNVTGHELRLNGTCEGGKFHMLYSESMEKAINLGTMKEGLIAFGDTFFDGKGQAFYDGVVGFIKMIPILGGISDAFFKGQVKITRIEFTMGSGMDTTYAFGFALLFKEKVSIAGIRIDYFTFEYEANPAARSVMNLSTPAHSAMDHE
jgi:hypothetical protein